ncbi:MAG: transcriptional regulator [Nitrospirales bacterium]|nr:transcriptional regulator [Nitrospirales bacterium]
MNVPFLDLQMQFNQIRSEIMSAIEAVCEEQHFILGSRVIELEQTLASYIGCDYAVGVASGSDALLLALMAVDVQPGDEVVTVPFTFFSTASVISRLQAIPVFIDIRPDTFLMDPAQLETRLTSRTKAIIPVHLFGQCADMDVILDVAHRKGIPVIEDACQAIGATRRGVRAGAWGVAGCFSFFPSKNLGGFGDGGLITTNDPDLRDTISSLRVHVSRSGYEHVCMGVNSRLDALQAAVLTVKSRYLDVWNATRRAHASLYAQLFAEANLLDRVSLPWIEPGNESIFHQYTIRAKHRDQLMAYLTQKGIGHRVYYPTPLHLQDCYRHLGYGPGSFPVSESAADTVLSLPIFPELSKEQIAYVVGTIQDFYRLG